MARITDLPPEIIQRIIDQSIFLTRENETWHQQFHHHHHHHHHPSTNHNLHHQLDDTVETNIINRTEAQSQNPTQTTQSDTNQPSTTQPTSPPIFAFNDFTILASGNFIDQSSAPTNHLNNDDVNHHQDPQEVLQVSWPDGLPSEPLVPFSLVNRTFQQCAQETLFRHVALYSPWQASLFLRTLNRSKSGSPIPDQEPTFNSIPVDIKGKRRAQCNEHLVTSPRTYRRLNRLGDYVRSLKFMWTGPASMGKGGGSLICDVLQSCPLLENIAISTALLSHCKEPLFNALESRTLVKEFLILKNPVENTRKFLWQADEVLSRLFTSWDFLETIEIIGLSGRSRDSMDLILKSIPTFSCSLKIISLIRPNLAEVELEAFLKNSKSTMNTLQITYPTSKLGRAGLYRILKDCTSSELESLTIQVGREWHPINTKPAGPVETDGIIGAGEDPSQNPHLADILFKSSMGLKKLKSLSIGGPLASSKLFNYLPDSIVKLAWEDCSDIHPAPFAKFLSGWSKPLKSDAPLFHQHHSPSDSNGPSSRSIRALPNLKCCSVGTDDFNWKRSDRRAVENALQERNACFHSSNCQALFPPAWFQPPNNSEDEQANTEEDFDLMTDGWPASEMEYNPHDGEEEDDDDEDRDDDEGDDHNDEDDGDEDGFDEGGGGASRNRRGRSSRGTQWTRPPPPIMFPGLFGLPMAAYTFPLNRPAGGGGHDDGATTWFFGAGTGNSSTNRPPHPTSFPNRSSSAHGSHHHNSNTAGTESSTNQSQNYPHYQPSSSSATANSHADQANRGSNTPASSSNSRPKSPGLFGPGFKFGKMFEK